MGSSFYFKKALHTKVLVGKCQQFVLRHLPRSLSVGANNTCDSHTIIQSLPPKRVLLRPLRILSRGASLPSFHPYCYLSSLWTPLSLVFSALWPMALGFWRSWC